MSTNPEERLAQARKIASAAQRKAKKIAADEAVNRSTRARNALKVRAEAFDQIAPLIK